MTVTNRIWFLRLATVAVGAALVVVAEGLLRARAGIGAVAVGCDLGRG